MHMVSFGLAQFHRVRWKGKNSSAVPASVICRDTAFTLPLTSAHPGSGALRIPSPSWDTVPHPKCSLSSPFPTLRPPLSYHHSPLCHQFWADTEWTLCL